MATIQWDQVVSSFFNQSTALATSVAIIWVVHRLLRFPFQLGLLERQILHLATADIGYVTLRSVPDLLNLFAALGHFIPRNSLFCSITNFSYSVPGMTSLLIQAEIAVGFYAAVTRKIGLLEKLGRWLRASWLLGFLLAVLDGLTARCTWHETDLNCQSDNMALVTVLTYCVTLTTGVICYALSAFRSRMSGHAVQRRIFARAATFPLVFIFTCAPITVGLLGIPPFKASQLYWDIVGPIYNLNGFINVIVYACTNRRVTNDIGGTECPMSTSNPDRARFPVAFQEEVGVAKIGEQGLSYSHDLIIFKKNAEAGNRRHRPRSFSTERDSRPQRSCQVDRYVMSGCKKGSARSTIMLRNIPVEYTRTLLLDLLDESGLLGSYDFVYLPRDNRKDGVVGYAFVNLTSLEEAQRAFATLAGFSRWKSASSSKVLEVTWAHPLQGLEAHVERFRNSPVMHENVPDEHRPALFLEGKRIDFPPPTQKLRPPSIYATRSFDAEVNLRHPVDIESAE